MRACPANFQARLVSLKLCCQPRSRQLPWHFRPESVHLVFAHPSQGEDCNNVIQEVMLHHADYHVFEDASEDWVSLMLNDTDLHVGAESSASFTSLGGLSLSELEEFDLTHMAGSCLSFAEYGGVSPDRASGDGPDVNSKSPNAVTTRENEQVNYLDILGSETALSSPPQSGVSYGDSEYPDANMSITVMDSGTEDDNLLFLVNRICDDEAGRVDNQDIATDPEKLLSISSTLEERSDDTSIYERDDNEQLHFRSDNGAKMNVGPCKVNGKKKAAVDGRSRSSTQADAATESGPKQGECKEEDDEKRQARLMRNRESAQLSRQRKKIYIDELQEKIKTMASTIAELNNTINIISAENIGLRRQLGYYGPSPGHPGVTGGASPWPGVYPCPPVMGGRFAMPGPQVPLVPLPRWRSPLTECKKKSKSRTQANEIEEKAPKRTKKLASVATLGIFCLFMFVLPLNLKFAALNPIFSKNPNTGTWYKRHSNAVIKSGGRILMGVEENANALKEESQVRWVAIDDRGPESDNGDSQTGSWNKFSNFHGNDNSGSEGKNGSVPLAATLFVPKNNRLVKIDGNLLIHSVLAGEKASKQGKLKSKRTATQASVDKGLALDANLKALAIKANPDEKGALVELQKNLPVNSMYDVEGGGGVEFVQEDGSLQQWFMEGLAGPVFSSGLCTEVFQFETSTSADAASHSSSTSEAMQFTQNNSSSKSLSDVGSRKAGRWLSSRKAVSYAVPLPPVGHKVSFNGSSSTNSSTGSRDGFQSNANFEEQKHTSALVVSVLTGAEFGAKFPRGSKGLSQIFVVVLIDSVKYVTYSCMLPSHTYEVIVT